MVTPIQKRKSSHQNKKQIGTARNQRTQVWYWELKFGVGLSFFFFFNPRIDAPESIWALTHPLCSCVLNFHFLSQQNLQRPCCCGQGVRHWELIHAAYMNLLSPMGARQTHLKSVYWQPMTCQAAWIHAANICWGPIMCQALLSVPGSSAVNENSSYSQGSCSLAGNMGDIVYLHTCMRLSV